jgi:hypothetical protein
MLAGELKRLRDDRGLAASVAEAGGRLVREEYNPEKIAARLLGILGPEGGE